MATNDLLVIATGQKCDGEKGVAMESGTNSTNVDHFGPEGRLHLV